MVSSLNGSTSFLGLVLTHAFLLCEFDVSILTTKLTIMKINTKDLLNFPPPILVRSVPPLLQDIPYDSSSIRVVGRGWAFEKRAVLSETDEN